MKKNKKKKMKYQLRIIVLSITTFGLLQGMEQESNLITGLPKPSAKNTQETAATWQLYKANMYSRIADALEARNNLKKEKLELENRKLNLKSRIFYLNNARSLYNSFSANCDEATLAKLNEKGGGKERKKGISEADAVAALTIIASECNEVKEVAAGLSKGVKRKSMKTRSARYLKKDERKATSKKDS